MTKITVSIVSALALAACAVAPEHVKALADLQAACSQGNRDACTAAGFQAQANQQEALANQAAAANIAAAILSGAAAGAAAADQNIVYVQPVYVDRPLLRWRRDKHRD